MFFERVLCKIYKIFEYVFEENCVLVGKMFEFWNDFAGVYRKNGFLPGLYLILCLHMGSSTSVKDGLGLFKAFYLSKGIASSLMGGHRYFHQDKKPMKMMAWISG